MEYKIITIYCIYSWLLSIIAIDIIIFIHGNNIIILHK